MYFVAVRRGSVKERVLVFGVGGKRKGSEGRDITFCHIGFDISGQKDICTNTESANFPGKRSC